MLELSPTPYGEMASSYLAQLQEILATISDEALDQAVALLLEARATGRRVYVFGNGGSAATASHLVCDLMKTAHVPPYAALRAFAVMDNVALLSAWSNDDAYESAVAEQLAVMVEPGDVVIAISASGRSPNVVEGLRAARRRGARTIGLLGFDGGPSLGLVDVAVHVRVDHYGLAEDAHSAIGHALTAAVRAALERGNEPLGPTGNGFR